MGVGAQDGIVRDPPIPSLFLYFPFFYVYVYVCIQYYATSKEGN